MADVSFTWNGPQATANMRTSAAQGLYLAAEHLLAESRKVVPIEEGTLSASGAASVDAGSLTAAVSYDTPYSVIQHESLDFWHDAGRTAKYLENPLNSESSTLQGIIAREIGNALE